MLNPQVCFKPDKPVRAVPLAVLRPRGAGIFLKIREGGGGRGEAYLFLVERYLFERCSIS